MARITKQQIKDWAERCVRSRSHATNDVLTLLKELLGRAAYRSIECMGEFETNQELHKVWYYGLSDKPINDYTLDEALQRVLDEIVSAAQDNSDDELTLEQMIEADRSLWYFDDFS